MAKRKSKEKDFQKVADEYARTSLESIRDMVEALEHAESCEEEGCTIGSETSRVRVPCRDCNGTGKIVEDASKEAQSRDCIACKGTSKVGVRQQIHEDPEAWHDTEQAQQRITEDALSVEVRSGWYVPGGALEDSAVPVEYTILLGTGGPAARIIGDLDEHCQPTSAHFEYQDWFKPWTRARLSSADEDVLLKYAQQFYFGE
jgi:hypothetical protein